MKVRAVVFVVAAVGVVVFASWGVRGTPAFGHYRGPYGDAVAQITEPQRHATNATTTTVMDVRAVDTIGEEFILLAAAVGVIMLLRKLREEGDGARPSGRGAPSMPVRVTCYVLVGPAALLGVYLVAHGAITPGGGFQGGVVLATPSVLMYLAVRARTFKTFHVPKPWEIAQAIAVAAFVAVGFVGLAMGRGFLANILSLGSSPGTILSAGTIPFLNYVAGPAVATAVVLIGVELLIQLTEVRQQ